MSEEKALKASEARNLSRKFHSPWPALLVIGTGIALLLANLLHFHLINVLWPGFIIAPGLMLIWPAYSATRRNNGMLAFLAVPGAILLAVGLMLFIMNLTHHYEARAYSWTLIPVAAMSGIMYAKRFDTGSRIHETGHHFNRFMLLLFMALAVLFEVVIFNNFNPWLSLGLIGYGFYLLLKDRHTVI